MPELLEHIGDYQQGRQLTRLAVTLTLYLFIRSRALRFARWNEIDFRHKIWTIPATHDAIDKVRFSGRGTKMRTPHIVPLSHQAVAILKQIKEISGHLEELLLEIIWAGKFQDCNALLKQAVYDPDIEITYRLRAIKAITATDDSVLQQK